jgi:hypothetical protein
MAYEIDKQMVDKAVQFIMREIGNGAFNHGEVLVALAECVGRVVIDAAQTPIAVRDATKVVADHITATCRAGAAAKGWNLDGH